MTDLTPPANEIIEWFSASDERKREILMAVGERVTKR